MTEKNIFPPVDLRETIREDCEEWERLTGGDQCLYLNTCKNSAATGLYQLIFNGCELWFGTLPEINAVVKSMLYQLVYPDRYTA